MPLTRPTTARSYPMIARRLARFSIAYSAYLSNYFVKINITYSKVLFAVLLCLFSLPPVSSS